MFHKKEEVLFGNSVEPDCSYCAHQTESGCDMECKRGPCASFRYDPLKRTPIQAPPRKQFDPDDFKL